MSVGFTVAVILEIVYHGTLPWAYGLTSGAVALGVNVIVYVVMAYLFPQDAAEKKRVHDLFEMISSPKTTLRQSPIFDSHYSTAVKN